MAVAGSDDLRDMAWLGSLVDDQPRQQQRESSSQSVPASQPLKQMASSPSILTDAQPVASPSSLAAQSPYSSTHAPHLNRADSRRRTSSGPLPPTTSARSLGAHSPLGQNGSHDGSARASPLPPPPRGPNTSHLQQQQQQHTYATRTPVHHSPSASHGSFFAAFRWPAYASPSSTASARSHSPTTSTASHSTSPSSASGGTGYVVPSIKDAHALNRSRTLAKQLLGPSSSSARSRSRDELSGHGSGGARDASAEGRRRYTTADPALGATREEGEDATANGAVSEGRTAGTSLHGAQQALAHDRSSPRSSTADAALEQMRRPEIYQHPLPADSGISSYMSEMNAGRRVVRIDDRLFVFDETGDRLDLVRDAPLAARSPSHPTSIRPTRISVPPPPSGTLSPSGSSAYSAGKPTSPLYNLHMPPASGAPEAFAPALQGISGEDHVAVLTSSASSGSGAFDGDALDYRFSTADSPGLTSLLRQDFASPISTTPSVPLSAAKNNPFLPASTSASASALSPSSALASASLHSSTSGPQRPYSIATSESLSTAEIEVVERRVLAHCGAQGQVVEFVDRPASLPEPGSSLLLAKDAGEGRAELEETYGGAARPEIQSRTSGLSERTIGPTTRTTTPSVQPVLATVVQAATLSPPLPSLPFERPRPPSAEASSTHASSHSQAAQRPAPPPLVIPGSTSDSHLASRAPAGGQEEEEDDKPLAAIKLQHRDSSPAVLASPTVASSAAAAGGESAPPPAVPAHDRPPPLPSKPASSGAPLRAQSAGAPPSSLFSSSGIPFPPPASSTPSGAGPRDPYEVLSRPMPRELDTSAQMKEKLMRSMTGFKTAKKSARSRMEQVVDAARHQLAAGSPLTAAHLGVPRSTSSAHSSSLTSPPTSHAAHPHGSTSSIAHMHGQPLGAGQPLPPLPKRPPSPRREALSPEVHTSDSLARRMAEVEDEEERRVAENMFM